MTDMQTVGYCITSAIAGIALTSAYFLDKKEKQEEAKRAKDLAERLRDTRIEPMAKESVQAFDNSLYYHAFQYNATAIRIRKEFRDLDGYFEIAVVGKYRGFEEPKTEAKTFARFGTEKALIGGYHVRQTYFAPFAEFRSKTNAQTEEQANAQAYEVALSYAKMASKTTGLPLQNGCGNKYKRKMQTVTTDGKAI